MPGSDEFQHSTGKYFPALVMGMNRCQVQMSFSIHSKLNVNGKKRSCPRSLSTNHLLLLPNDLLTNFEGGLFFPGSGYDSTTLPSTLRAIAHVSGSEGGGSYLPPSLTVVNIVSFRKEGSEAAERIKKFPKCCVTFPILSLIDLLSSRLERAR